MNILHAINKTPWPSIHVKSIRLWDTDDTAWPQIETSPGKFDWKGLDRWLALAKAHNADVVYTFGRVPRWANGGKHQSQPPTDLKVWDDFVRAIVHHANGRIAAWELWNEPNDPNFWTGDTATLLQMTQHAYQIIKSEQPNAIVLTPSATWHQTSPSEWFERYFGVGGGKYADVIAFHGYVGTSPEGLARELQRIRDIARKYDVEKPIWDTESSWGIDSKLTDPKARAEFLARSYILHVSQGVHRFYWYAWDGSDGGQTAPDESWGTLWDSKNGEHEAARTYRTVQKWLRDAQLPLLCHAADSIWQCNLNGSSLIVWSTTGQRNFQLDPSYNLYEDLSEQRHKIPDSHSVSIGSAPILISKN